MATIQLAVQTFGRERAAGVARAVAFGLVLWPVAGLAQDGFLSTRPTLRHEYWQVRETEIAQQLDQGQSLARYKLVFIGNTITDFWQMQEDLWVKGRWHGGAVWDETFAGTDPAYRALNLDLNPAFLDRDGRQRSDLLVDGLQPNIEGYRAWRDHLVPTIVAGRAKQADVHSH